jgi:hypothetical protein
MVEGWMPEVGTRGNWLRDGFEQFAKFFGCRAGRFVW